MKSLVEEASTVAKAIEKAWNRAGNPQTFSVKVFENPETNFFGFTKKSAKVGIFFEEEAPQPVKKYTNNRDNRSQNTQRQNQKGRDQALSHSREAETEQPTRQQYNRPARPQNNRPVRQAQQPATQPNLTNNEQGPAPRSREEQPRSARSTQEQRQPRTHERSNDRQKNNDRQSAPYYEQPRQTRDEYAYDSFKEERPSHTQSAPAEYASESFERSERDTRNGYEGNERSERSSDRNNRNGRRSSHGNSRNDKNGVRPQRAQRHEFNEDREMVNFASEQVPQQEPQHSSVPNIPETASQTASLIPQKKVLRVSGRRYSAPTKPATSDDNE